MDDLYQKQRDVLLTLFKELFDLSNAQGKNGVLQHLREDADRLAKGKLFVVVAGEFKQGKSSLVDALLDEPNLFPDNPDIATCLVSSIRYAPQEKITVIVGQDKGKPEQKVISRAEICDYVLESRNPNNRKNARMISIEAPNPHLKNGLMLIDTPGTGGLFKQHSEITYAFLPQADAVLYVSDALSPLSVKDLEFIQTISNHCKRIIFVLTKTDLRSEEEYQVVLDSNRAKLTALSCLGEDICIVPISSFLKLSYLQSQDEEDLLESNFATLEQELWTILDKRGEMLLQRALKALTWAILELQAPLQAEKETLEHNPKIAETKQQLKATAERMRQLDLNKNEWRMQILQGVRSLREKVSYQFQYSSLDSRKKLDGYLAQPDLLHDPLKLLAIVDEDTHLMMSTIDSDLNKQVQQLLARVQENTGLGLHSPTLSIINYEKPTSVALSTEVQGPKKQQGWWGTLMTGMSRGSMESRGASTLGSVVGGTLGLGLDILTMGATGGLGLFGGAWIGGKLGSLAGYRTGITRGIEQAKTMEIAEARRKIEGQLMLYIEQNKLLCNKIIAEVFEQLESTLVQEFTQMITQELTSSEDLLRTISESQKLSQAQAEQRLREVLPQLQIIERLRIRIEHCGESLNATDSDVNDYDGVFANA